MAKDNKTGTPVLLSLAITAIAMQQGDASNDG